MEGEGEGEGEEMMRRGEREGEGAGIGGGNYNFNLLKALLVEPPIFLTSTSLPPDGAGDPVQARTRRQ